MSVLAVRSLSKAFGGVRAVNDVSFDVEPRRIPRHDRAERRRQVHLLQHDQRPARAGLRRDPVRGQEHRRPCAARHLAARRRPHLPGRRDLRLDDGRRERADGADLARRAKSTGSGGRPPSLHRERALELLAQVGMRDAADRPSRELAYGDVKRVELAIALANEPRLLLMDEPTAGMAPRERNELIALVKRLVVERGISVLFTEHSMDVVFAYADRIIVLARGRLIADGDAAAIRDDAAGARGLFRHRQDVCAASAEPRHERCHARGRGLQRLVRRGAHPLRPELRGRPRRGGGADGPQRRRQVHHHEGDHGPDRPSAGHGALQRRGYLAPQAVRDRAARPRLHARGPPHLLRSHGDGKSRRRPPAAAPLRRRHAGAGLDAGEAVRAVSQSRRDAEPARAAA